jgi:predicted lipid-binding transport protein (Tim44 family)
MIRFLGICVAGLATMPAAVAVEAGAEHPGVGLGPWLFTGVLLVVLAILGGMLLVRRSGARGTAAGAASTGGHSQFDPVVPRHYSPQNVGNDASARPWERQVAVDLASGRASSVPEGFDAEAFLNDSKANFTGLQAAWDRADIPALRAMMTEAMLVEIQEQLAERERTGGRADTRSEVIMIEAQLLGIEELSDSYTASVEFSGLMREGFDAGPSPFRELWNITRPKDGDGRWLVAGVQALH